MITYYFFDQFGFLGPDGSTNLGLKDIVTALRFMQKVTSGLGGSPAKITVAGQSSGANLIRALLAVPSASSMFQSAILQSDPMVWNNLSYAISGLILIILPGLWFFG